MLCKPQCRNHNIRVISMIAQFNTTIECEIFHIEVDTQSEQGERFRKILLINTYRKSILQEFGIIVLMCFPFHSMCVVRIPCHPPIVSNFMQINFNLAMLGVPCVCLSECVHANRASHTTTTTLHGCVLYVLEHLLGENLLSCMCLHLICHNNSTHHVHCME